MSGQVDLSLCLPGDVLHRRDGNVDVYDGPTRPGYSWSKTHPFGTRSNGAYTRTGVWSVFEGEADGWDIIRVTRDGKTVTPVEAGVVEWKTIPGCSCETCWDADHIDQILISQRMHLCPTCGNKRCPKATYHGNACTGSNEVGQPGSSWENVKPWPQPSPAAPPVGKPAFNMADDEASVKGSVAQAAPPVSDKPTCICGHTLPHPNGRRCCADCDDQGLGPVKPIVTETVSDKPVVTGPGRYVEMFSQDGQYAEIVGRSSDGFWIGFSASGDLCGWSECGAEEINRDHCHRLIGPYVSPPPQPPTLLEAAKAVVDFHFIPENSYLAELRDAVQREEKVSQ